MKKFLLACLALVFSVSSVFALSVVPGPPERFKNWPQLAERQGACPDSRLLKLTAYAKDADFINAGVVVYSDNAGPFVWIFYTEKDEEANARWVVIFDGTKYVQGSIDEIAKLFKSPCDIPRPNPEQRM